MVNFMRKLIDWLNARTKEYDAGAPTVSDATWDEKYFELQNLEKETGIVYPNSPTHKISYDVINELEKVKHSHPMLSLAKTKSDTEVEDFINKYPSILMAKMDGLTCSLTYEKGVLVKAETRGDGEIGENIFHNANVVKNIPIKLSEEVDIIVDGEIICTYGDFEEFKNDYKNPRNFAAGSIRLLDSGECARRNLTFVAWDYINNPFETLYEGLSKLGEYGFTIVTSFVGNNFDTIKDNIVKECEIKGYPIDGIVIKINDVKKYAAQGMTAHHPSGALAYKFFDEEYETKLINIEWGMGRSGVLTPVAVFEPVNIDGAEVTRANLHNISVARELIPNPWVGLTIWVYRSNQIIPQVLRSSNEPPNGERIYLPTKCPVCGGAVSINVADSGTETLVCNNPMCSGKTAERIEHFCSKKAMDIKGLSEQTIAKLMDWGWVENCEDIFLLSSHRSEWIKKSGFGVASVDKILNAIESAKNCTLDRFICALGIPEIGTSASKIIAKLCGTYSDFREKINNLFDFSILDDIGEIMSGNILLFNYDEADRIAQHLNIAEPEEETKISTALDGMTVCITGKLNAFKNRAELVSAIEARGGKTASSVSRKTNYLIANTAEDTSKYNNAVKYNIPILTEEEFIEKFFDK